jgi:hypothetical protein
MMFIKGSVAPAHTDATKEATKKMRSFLDEYESILYFLIS